MQLKTQQIALDNEKNLTKDLEARRFIERKTALNLTQFKSNNAGLNIRNDEIDNLIMTLEVGQRTPPNLRHQLTI